MRTIFTILAIALGISSCGGSGDGSGSGDTGIEGILTQIGAGHKCTSIDPE